MKDKIEATLCRTGSTDETTMHKITKFIKQADTEKKKYLTVDQFFEVLGSGEHASAPVLPSSRPPVHHLNHHDNPCARFCTMQTC